jgi:hypothetical protein
MNKAALSSVLKLFALLFSERWVNQWQREQQKRPPAEPTPTRWKTRKKWNRSRPKERALKKNKRGFYKRIFTLRVVLWYLIFQRLNFDQSLAAVMRDLRRGGADRLGPRGRKLSKKVKSSRTSAYNQARQRMPLELLQAAFAYLGQQIRAMAGLGTERPKEKPAPQQRQRQLIDGSTLRMLATPELKKAYRPARGRKGDTDWCLMRIVVGFCTRTGAILSAMERAATTSEQAIAWAIMETAGAFIIWIGDRNFGIWSVLAQAVRYEQDVVVRLTRARAGKLAGGRALGNGEDRALLWSPSCHDQGAPGTKREPIAGRLIYVRLRRGGKWIDLWLFTTLDATDYPLQLLVQWYGQRWQAELHFRSVKTQMRLAQLDICSPEAARKELYAAFSGYNLVRAVMWAAGERLESGVQTLSFSNARRVVLDWLLDWASGVGQASGSNQRWAQSLLEETRQQKLPKRKKPRPTQVRMVRSCASKWPILKGSRAAAQKRCEKRTKCL